MKENINIHDRIYKFVLLIINLTKELPRNHANDVIIHQVIKSATSMGANDQEADGAQTAKDFIAKYSIVKKETKETIYWLQIIADTNPLSFKKSLSLKEEGIEIVKIISTIIINTKKKVDFK